MCSHLMSDILKCLNFFLPDANTTEYECDITCKDSGTCNQASFDCKDSEKCTIKSGSASVVSNVCNNAYK